jgi:hypothetical protein
MEKTRWSYENNQGAMGSSQAGNGSRRAYNETVERTPAVVVPLIVRGAALGFCVFVAGELLVSALARTAPALAGGLLALVGLAAPALAGLNAGRAGPPALQGALAGLGAYVLTLPLRALVGGVLTPVDVVAPIFSAAIGGLAGSIAGRPRSNRRS